MRYVEERMKHTLVWALCVSALCACNKGSAAKLEGRWHGIKATGVAADQLKAANLFASTMELEFHGDQVSVHTGGDKQSTRFHVARDEARNVTIVTDQDGPDDKQSFTFSDDKTIDWAILPGKTIQFAHE
jgi:hypothetical protein